MLVATSTAVYTFGPGTVSGQPEATYEGTVRHVAEGQRLNVIGTGDGALLCVEGGNTTPVGSVTGPTIESIQIVRADPLTLLVGTEPPHVYRVTEGGAVERIEGFDRLDCREAWTTPWGGPPAVRSFAATGDGWVYADIHVGSIVRSPDRGTTWEPVTPDLHVDVHQVAVTPADDDRVYANTADAVFVSEDRGGSWSHRAEGFPYAYGRAVTVHPEDPDCLMASVSEGPRGTAEGRLFRSDDCGRTWQHVSNGFPATTEGNIDTFHIAFSADGTAWGCVDDRLFRSEDRGSRWEEAWQAPEDILMLACSR